VPKAEKIKCPLCGVKWKIKENRAEKMKNRASGNYKEEEFTEMSDFNIAAKRG